MEYATSSAYNRPPGLLIAILGLCGPAGAVMILIGREYYDATNEVREKTEELEEAARKDHERRKLVGF